MRRQDLLGAAVVGIAAGIRSMTPGAILSWAGAHGTQRYPAPLTLLRRPLVTDALAVAALGEIVVDKLPIAPPRTMPASWVWRSAMGAGGGYSLARAAGSDGIWAAVAGGIAAAAATYVTYRLREAAIHLGIPNALAGSIGDMAAVLLSLAAVRR